MKNIFASHKILATVVLLNIFMAGLYWYLFSKITQEQVRIAALTDTITTETAQKEQLVSIKDRITETAASRAKLDGYFVGKDAVVPFLNYLQSMGAENNLKLKVNSVGIDAPVDAAESYEVLRLSLEVNGAWSDVYHFMALAELLPYKTKVTKVDLERVDVETDGKTTKILRQWKGVFEMEVLKLK